MEQSGLDSCLTAPRQAQGPGTGTRLDPAFGARNSSKSNNPYLLEGDADLACEDPQAAAVFLEQARRERTTLSLEASGAAVTPVLTQAVTHILVTLPGEYNV
jgi:hypothetical protein